MSMPRTPLEAVTRRRFLASAWPWRSAGYLVTTAPVALAAGVPLLVLGLPLGIMLRRVLEWHDPSLIHLALLLLGGSVLFAGLGPLIAVPIAVVERRRLGLVDTRPTHTGHRPLPSGGPGRWLRVRYSEPATWRELIYAALLAGAVPIWYGVVLVFLVLILVSIASPFLVDGQAPISLGAGQVVTVADAVPYSLVGLGLLPAIPYLVALLAGTHAAMAQLLLSAPANTGLRAELIEVSRSRARLVDAFEAERLRIERDLHDGAQQRLVSLTLQLGLARVDLAKDSPAGQAVAGAHEQAKMLMAELRELIHGIRPQTLTEVGLPRALGELADQAPIPVTVRADLPDRPPPGVESVAYFVATEALTNVFKHAQATTATVTVFERDNVLTVEVLDDGRGGADPSHGTGLTGLADRVAVADGRIFLSSPAGGPTLIRVEVPCRAND